MSASTPKDKRAQGKNTKIIEGRATVYQLLLARQFHMLHNRNRSIQFARKISFFAALSKCYVIFSDDVVQFLLQIVNVNT